jgi:UDP-3-O-[3-hydroxymyristoyl] glucosamine N-acyltransferase LpxD
LRITRPKVKGEFSVPNHSATPFLEEIIAAFPELLAWSEFQLNPKYSVGSNQTAALKAKVSGVASPEASDDSKILFLATEKAIRAGLNAAALTIVVPKKQIEFLKTIAAETRARELPIVLVSEQVELAMAKVIGKYFLSTPYRASYFGENRISGFDKPHVSTGAISVSPTSQTNSAIKTVTSTSTGLVRKSSFHSTAVIDSTAEISESATIGPFAVIARNVKIGKNSFIGAHTVIEAGAVIGEDTTLHPLVYIGHSTLIGSRCEVHAQSVIGKDGYGYVHDKLGQHHRIPHQGRVVLEDDVHIGSSCSLDRGTFGETRICKGAKLDNQIHIAHNCEIGAHSLVTAGFMTAGSTKIGARFISGGGAVVAGHIKICDNVQVGGFSAVTKSIDQPGQYAGNPLLPLSQFLKLKLAMTLLPDLVADLRKMVRAKPKPGIAAQPDTDLSLEHKS